MKVFNTGETDVELKEKYNPEGSDLRKAQLRMLDMVLYLDKLFKEHNITYYIEGGNLLGAVRHGGFIPWDDDFDIVVDIKDIKKIKKLFKDNNGEFVLQTHKTDKGCVKYWPVLRDMKSEYVKDDVSHKAQKYRGLQVDIFPFDYGKFKKMKRFIQLLIIFNQRYLVGKHKVLSSLVYYFPKIFIIPICELVARLFQRKTYGYSFHSFFQRTFKFDDIYPPREIDFEGYKLPTFNNIDAYLKTEYGENYMNLPSIESRSHHKISKILFFE